MQYVNCTCTSIFRLCLPDILLNVFLAIAVDNLESVQMKDEIDREKAELKAAISKNPEPTGGAFVAPGGEDTAAKEAQPRATNPSLATDKLRALQVAFACPFTRDRAVFHIGEYL